MSRRTKDNLLTVIITFTILKYTFSLNGRRQRQRRKSTTKTRSSTNTRPELLSNLFCTRSTLNRESLGSELL
jgi:putative exporter of polyketide antibiotics